MNQLLLGVIAFASVVLAFWRADGLARLLAVLALVGVVVLFRPVQKPMLRAYPMLTSTDLLVSSSGGFGAATFLGVSIASRRWPDALVYAFNVVVLGALLAFQARALERGPRAVLAMSTQAGARSGVICLASGLLVSMEPIGPRFLVWVLLQAAMLAVLLWRESRPLHPSVNLHPIER